MFVGEAQLLLLLLLLMLAHLFSTSHDIGSQLYGHVGSQLYGHIGLKGRTRGFTARVNLLTRKGDVETRRKKEEVEYAR